MMDRAGNSMLWKKLHDPESFTPRAKQWQPMQNQFPSKYDQLPGIGAASPRSSTDNQLIPMRNYRKGSPELGRKDTIDMDTEERVRQLEMRLAVSEKSNRALLEEVLRLQSDLRNTSKRSEDVMREERESRQQLSEAIRISNELISQLSARIKETEDKIEDEKESLNALFSHTKNVEKSVVHSQQEIQQRRDAQQMKLQELRSELNETKSSRNQLEQVTYALSEELRTLKARLETQQNEFGNMINEVRNRARKLEDENRINFDSMRKQSELHNMTDVTTSQLRGQVENRLSELRDVLMDLRGKHETEQSERRNLEKVMQTKINDLSTSISEQVRKREENMHTVDMVLREKEHAAQAERLQINAKVSDTVEDVNKRLLTKEMKIREEIQSKYLQLEKLVQREQQSRQDYEKSTREEADRKWQTLKKVLEEELHGLKENLSGEKSRNRETINKLDQSISIVEKQLAENKKQVDKIMTAEIKSRKIHEAGTTEQISSVNQKLQIATSTLQQAIGGISQNLSTNSDKIKREMKQLMTDQQQGSTRALSDMDTKLSTMKQRLNNLEDMLDAKVASGSNGSVTEASQSMSERTNEKLEAITKWQDATGDTLRELGRSVQTMPQDIYQLEEKFKLTKSEMDNRVSHETDSRTREVEALRQEIQTLKSRLDRQPKPASLQDLEAMNVGVRKLADNLQTVKTVLGMKIQSEQKLRFSGLEDLQTQINQLKILTGSQLKIQPTHRSQMDDLDTGLGWDDMGSYGTYTGTPSTSMANDRSRQHMSDPLKPVNQPIREDTREGEESPFETKGGLKSMNVQSPTPRGGNTARSPEFKDDPTQGKRTPGNVTPDDWRLTPRDGNKTPETGRTGGAKTPKDGNKTPVTGRTGGAKTPKDGKKTPETSRTGGRKSSQSNKGGAKSPGKTTPPNQTPPRTPANPNNQSQNNGGQSQRQQDSGLDDI